MSLKQRQTAPGASTRAANGQILEAKGHNVASSKAKVESAATKIKEQASVVAQTTVPAAVYWALTLGLIFGGCCSNVFALEAIIKDEPDSGLLITFIQFVMVAVLTMPSHISFSNPPFFLKKRAVPIKRWIPGVLLFFIVNMMNNFAFGFKISVPVHIILRSGGSVMTLVVGYFWGKRYNKLQVGGVVMLTVGVIVAAMADAQAKGEMASSQGSDDMSSFVSGLAILFVAQLLSAIMGVWVQETYAIYGSQWQENLFYSHFLSIPMFLPFVTSSWRQFLRLVNSPPFPVTLPNTALLSAFGATEKPLFTLPTHVVTLLLNSLTQYACIRGVNLLGARTTALGVTIVLNLRKLISLFASIWLFGNTLPAGVSTGAAVVFSGAAVYAWGGTRRKVEAKPKKA